MAGLPNLEQTRSLSRYGLSQVTVIFKDGTDIFLPASWSTSASRRPGNKLPAGITPALGPISTGLGEIYLWTVEAEGRREEARRQPYTPTDLREIQDWIIKPQLRNVPGVTEINSIGGFAKEYQIAPDPRAPGGAGPDLCRMWSPRWNATTATSGAGYIERAASSTSSEHQGR
jgi:cobalt-zinc-cadmium resistance protein CzcA